MSPELYGLLDQVWRELLRIGTFILTVFSEIMLALCVLGSCAFVIQQNRVSRTNRRPTPGPSKPILDIAARGIINAPHPTLLEELRLAGKSRSHITIREDANHY